jgi:predicted dehydrogenase
MADAVARSGKVLQVGTQSRSTAVVRDAIERVRGGAIGEVLVAKAWNSQQRSSIGKKGPSEPPKQLDYDRWVGPRQTAH